jgi:arylsulfatase A-like enzyme
MAMLLAVWLFVATDVVASGVPTARPNLLLLHADDLGYGDLAAYGHPTSSTPFIDALAREGLRLTQWYSASPVCSPARAGILTGRWPARIGVYCANNTVQVRP